MKILMYSILDTERPYVEAWVNKTGHQVKMVEEGLNKETAKWAAGFDGIDFQQTNDLDPEVYATLEVRDQAADRPDGWV